MNPRTTCVTLSAVLLVAYLGLSTGCAPEGADPDWADLDGLIEPLEERTELAEVGFWAYQLQGHESQAGVDALVDSHYDLLVLEPIRSERDSRDFNTAGLVAHLHASDSSVAGRGKLVIAYVNIGEAEDWRFYWENNWRAPTRNEPGTPDFIVTRDPDGWEGDYPVAYWDSRWRDIVIHDDDSLLRQVLADGFDGIYLDWVGGYEEDAVVAAAQEAGVDPTQEMVDFICAIRTAARAENPDFIVIPQNATELAQLVPGYLDCVDAVAQEHVYFNGNEQAAAADLNSGDVPLPETGEGYSRAYFEQTLTPFLEAGKVVFTVDYAQEPANVAEAYTRSATQGYIPYVTLLALDHLTATPPPDYAE